MATPCGPRSLEWQVFCTCYGSSQTPDLQQYSVYVEQTSFCSVMSSLVEYLPFWKCGECRKRKTDGGRRSGPGASSPVAFTDEWMDLWQSSEWYRSTDWRDLWCHYFPSPVHSVHSLFSPSRVMSCVTNAVLRAFWLVPLLGFNKSLANIKMALPALSLGCRD